MKNAERAEIATLSAAANKLYAVGLVLLGVSGLIGLIGGIYSFSTIGVGGLLILIAVASQIWLLYLILTVATKFVIVQSNNAVTNLDLLSELKGMRVLLGGLSTLHLSNDLVSTGSSGNTSVAVVERADYSVRESGEEEAAPTAKKVPHRSEELVLSNRPEIDSYLLRIDGLSEDELNKLCSMAGIFLVRLTRCWKGSASNGLSFYAYNIEELRRSVANTILKLSSENK